MPPSALGYVLVDVRVQQRQQHGVLDLLSPVPAAVLLQHQPACCHTQTLLRLVADLHVCPSDVDHPAANQTALTLLCWCKA